MLWLTRDWAVDGGTTGCGLCLVYDQVGRQKQDEHHTVPAPILADEGGADQDITSSLHNVDSDKSQARHIALQDMSACCGKNY